jgi:prepilin-type processing-associated H-X9-DG protein
MKSFVNQENINQFNGISELYKNCRPVHPDIIVKTLLIYLGKMPDVVIDIGSGTGLSTQLWSNVSKEVIGIEPNKDMRQEAIKHNKNSNVSFVDGLSNNTGISDDYADIVTVAQAFHWFDIDSTLDEVYRILKPNGVFAVYDCELLPSFDWKSESAYIEVRKKCDKICASAPRPSIKNDRSSYIKRFNEFGKFQFVKEVVCHNVEKCDVDRMKGIIYSQGVIKLALKLDEQISIDVIALTDMIEKKFKGTFDMICSYRIRLGIK